MRTKLVCTDINAIGQIVEAILETSDVRVTGYTVYDTYVEFDIEAVERPDPYRDLGFTHDFSFNGVGAYQHRVRKSRRRE